jgi:hypothetical protein
MFWKRKQAKEGEIKLTGPRKIPDLVGRYMVVEMQKEPDWVWTLKGVVRPTGKKNAFFCRVFNEAQTVGADVKVKDWTSLDEHPELVLWEGYFEKDTNTVLPEKRL